MDDPYRGSTARAAPGRRVRLPEVEPAPLRFSIGARQYSDGSTELRFGAAQQPLWLAVFMGLCGLFILFWAAYEVVACFGPGVRSGEAAAAVVFLGIGLLFVELGFGSFYGGERIVLGHAALWYRASRWRRAEVVLLSEVRNIVVTGSGRAACVDLELGQRTLPILRKTRYSEEQLRWCAQRLRRALDHAGSVVVNRPPVEVVSSAAAEDAGVRPPPEQTPATQYSLGAFYALQFRTLFARDPLMGQSAQASDGRPSAALPNARGRIGLRLVALCYVTIGVLAPIGGAAYGGLRLGAMADSIGMRYVETAGAAILLWALLTVPGLVVAGWTAARIIRALGQRPTS